MAPVITVIWQIAMLGLAASASSQRPICQMSDAFTMSVDMHLRDWDSQIDFALNESLNCSDFLEYVYLSRDRIRQQLDFVRGNFSAEDEAFRLQGAVGGSSAWAMTHMSQAASLLSAHIHIHGILSGARPECLNEHLQLLFLMSLRRMKQLMQSQLRHLWLVFQGTAELVRQGAGKWLNEVVELFEADIRTYESIMVNWRSKEEIEARKPFENFESWVCWVFFVFLDWRAVWMAKGGLFKIHFVWFQPFMWSEANSTGPIPLRPGPPLPAFELHEADGVALSTIEVLRRDTFEEWNVPKSLLRALLRYVLPRDGHVADFCAGAGAAANFLNDTGLVKAYAFDASTNIKLLSKNMVEHLRLHAEEMRLWRSFDVTMCLTDFGTSLDAWAQVWKNLETSTKRIAVLNCGAEQVRQQAMNGAAIHAPALAYDEQLSSQFAELYPGICIFWRRPAASWKQEDKCSCILALLAPVCSGTTKPSKPWNWMKMLGKVKMNVS